MAKHRQIEKIWPGGEHRRIEQNMAEMHRQIEKHSQAYTNKKHDYEYVNRPIKNNMAEHRQIEKNMAEHRQIEKTWLSRDK